LQFSVLLYTLGGIATTNEENDMAEPTPKTVLIVDDDEDVRKFLRTALIETGFNVVTASDGFEALEAIRKQIPDLISLDLVMPKKSGIAFYKDLVKNNEWSKIPVMVVTGHARDELGRANLEELTMTGPGVYLEKPVRPEDYIASVKQILNSNKSAE
jgi:CheY-like chemotaxis protein